MVSLLQGDVLREMIFMGTGGLLDITAVAVAVWLVLALLTVTEYWPGQNPQSIEELVLTVFVSPFDH